MSDTDNYMLRRKLMKSQTGDDEAFIAWVLGQNRALAEKLDRVSAEVLPLLEDPASKALCDILLVGGPVREGDTPVLPPATVPWTRYPEPVEAEHTDILQGSDWEGEYRLVCAGCEGDFLHQIGAEIFFRNSEDDQKGDFWAITKAAAHNSDDAHTLNPSPHRHAARLLFTCEHCDQVTGVSFYQDQGHTLVVSQIVGCLDYDPDGDDDE